MKFRFERKYYLNVHTALILKQRIAAVLRPDRHNDGQYHISSLYFDDLYDTAYCEKRDSLHIRDKYRVRHYNGDLSTLKLECKRKRGEFISKASVLATPEQYDLMLQGDLGFAEALPDKLWQRLFLLHKTKHLSPVVLIDYDRHAFVYPPGDVRVTFDTDLQVCCRTGRAFERALPLDCTVLEVKYTRFLPSVVAGLLGGLPLIQTPISKYILARDKMWEMNRYVFTTS